MKNKSVIFIITRMLAMLVVSAIILSGCSSTIHSEIVSTSMVIPTEGSIFATESTESVEITESTVETVIEQTESTEPTELTEPKLLTLAEIEPLWQSDAEFLAKVVWGEARGCSIAEREKVVWCVLNRVDHPNYPNSIQEVILQPYQFLGFNMNHPITQENYELALRIIGDWLYEKTGGVINRPLGPDYIYFYSDGTGMKNIFTTTWG